MIKEILYLQLKSVLRNLPYTGITLLVPLALLLNGIVWSMNPAYPHQAYRTLPPDEYGWSQAERLDLALITLTYLQHPESAETAVRFLEEERMPGTQKPLYNERELAHLVDVKRVVDALNCWASWSGWLLLFSLAALIWPKTRFKSFWALWRGVKLSGLLLVAALLLFSLVWSAFFNAFHHLLFPPGSWHFPATDSLIRLFPESFWLGYARYLVAWQALVIGSLLVLMGVVALFSPKLTPEQAAERALAELFWDSFKYSSRHLLTRKKPEPEPSSLPLDQFIYYSDLAAYDEPSEGDDDEDDELFWQKL